MVSSNSEIETLAQFYKKRFGFSHPNIKTAPLPDVKISIVIPCYKEPDLLATLNALAQCEVTNHAIEVIIVINSSAMADEEGKSANQKTKEEAIRWIDECPLPKVHFHIMEATSLPPKHAGVGLARKIGMDEALYRFGKINYNGLIVCLDADCVVSPNYLKVLEDTFLSANPKGCNIYFEHDLSEISDPDLKEGIIYYELFLRYYVQALRYCQFPFAVHTIGSSMAVRADIYAKTGGMNRRKAGEDFYFIHKIAPHGNFKSIITATVYPSARISDRVPFGTGKAQQNWKNEPDERKLTYDLQIFEDLKQFINSTPEFYSCAAAEVLENKILQLPSSIQNFLKQEDFNVKLAQIQQYTNNEDSFYKRFFTWLDGFKVLKYVHFARDHFYPNLTLVDQAQKLLQITTDNTVEKKAEALLTAYRAIDKTQ